jgi:hypothetical protein
MTQIICPPDLIATITALTLSIRVLGGSIGYCIYYNVFISKFTPNAIAGIGAALAEGGITDVVTLTEVITLTGNSLLEEIALLPGIAGNETLYNAVVLAGQVAYAESYKYVYYTSTAFGAISIIAALFVGDISEFMDDKIAVVM